MHRKKMKVEVEIVKHDPLMQDLRRKQGRVIIPWDAPSNHPSGDYRMLPPKPSVPKSTRSIQDGLSSDSFTLFPEFPVELRLKIWRHAFPGPRVVKVSSYGTVTQDGYCFHAFSSTSPVPVVLSVCQESREEALRHYHLSFGMRSPAIPSIIYFNYELDTLYFEFDSHQALNSQLLIMALPDRYGQVDGRVGMKFVQSVAVSQRIGLFKLKLVLKYLMRFEGFNEFVVGAERESPPVSDEAVLEEPEEGDVTLNGIRKVLDEAREEWNEIWKERRGGSKDGTTPELKIMEVRGSRP